MTRGAENRPDRGRIIERLDGCLNPPLFSPGMRVAAAVSGGADSVCLFDLLCRNRERLGIELSCVNVDHGIRERSSSDSAFVRELCRERGIPCFGFRADVPAHCREKGVSLETGARELRYRCFQSLFDEGRADAVAVAHNRGDRAETALFQLIRGSGPAGLCSLRARGGEPSPRYLRPLLGVDRAEILDYLKVRGLTFVEDESNTDLRFTRNRLRLEALPLLERIHPGAAAHIAECSERMEELCDFVSPLSRPYLAGENAVSVKTPGPLLYFAVRETAFGRVVRNLTAAHYRAIGGLAAAENGSRISLPGGWTAERQYDRISFCRDGEPLPAPRPFALGRFAFGDAEIGVFREPPQGKFDRVLRAGADRIPAGALFRTPEPGDTFRKFGGGGSKKLCDLLTDWKGPRRERERLCVLAKGSRVLCLPFRDISEDLRADGESIYLTYSKIRREKN